VGTAKALGAGGGRPGLKPSAPKRGARSAACPCNGGLVPELQHPNCACWSGACILHTSTRRVSHQARLDGCHGGAAPIGWASCANERPCNKTSSLTLEARIRPALGWALDLAVSGSHLECRSRPKSFSSSRPAPGSSGALPRSNSRSVARSLVARWSTDLPVWIPREESRTRPWSIRSTPPQTDARHT
jgi:hypothetical protein